MREFWLSFVPLFVAVDVVGVLPLFLGLTEGLDRAQRNAVVRQSVLTATAVALTFLVFGRALLRLLGITVADFIVAGGALLFVLSLTDLLAKERSVQALDRTTLGAVPLGVPLLAGPAVLTTCLLLVDQYGVLLASGALLANMALAALVFLLAARIHRVLGTTGTRIVQRVTLLLLAAIAVMTVRKGIETYLQAAAKTAVNLGKL